jgi:NADH-quinone oxidoreductase subunit E
MMDKQQLIHRFAPNADNLILILHELQNNHPQHYLEEADLDMVANYLSMTKSQVYGVVTYYSMFSLKPRGKYIIRICKSPVCELEEGSTIEEAITGSLGIKAGETTSDGRFTLEYTICLGHCDKSPVVMINEDVHGDLKPGKLPEILSEYK